MTQDEIIEMAKQSGFSELEFFGTKVGTNVTICLEAFAERVAAKEREACAKVCDELHWEWHMGDNSGPKECAETIRARGG